MNFVNLLQEKKATIAKKWFELIADTYHPDTARFLKKESDPFSNPVGQTTIEGTEKIFDYLLDRHSPDSLENFLDPMIRIRAIQDFTPANAVGFLYEIKQIVRDSLKNELKNNPFIEELYEFDRKVDQLALRGFDIYMACREKIYDLKANEMRNRSFQVLKRANLIKNDEQ